MSIIDNRSSLPITTETSLNSQGVNKPQLSTSQEIQKVSRQELENFSNPTDPALKPLLAKLEAPPNRSLSLRTLVRSEEESSV